ncbi:MAG: hypothetical protein R2758_06640 [Bacteroidales bacterium]
MTNETPITLMTHNTLQPSSKRENDYVFQRKERDTRWEKHCIDALDEAGLVSDDGIHFTTPGSREDADNALYDLIEAVGYNRKKFEDAGLIIRTWKP